MDGFSSGTCQPRTQPGFTHRIWSVKDFEQVVGVEGAGLHDLKDLRSDGSRFIRRSSHNCALLGRRFERVDDWLERHTPVTLKVVVRLAVQAKAVCVAWHEFDRQSACLAVL